MPKPGLLEEYRRRKAASAPSAPAVDPRLEEYRRRKAQGDPMLSPGVTGPLPGMAPVAAEAGARARSIDFERLQSEVERRFPDPNTAEGYEARKRLQGIAARAKGALRGEGVVRELAERAGDGPTLKSLIVGGQQPVEPDTGFLEKLATVLGTGGRVVRNAALAPLDEETDFSPVDAFTNDQSWASRPGTPHSAERYNKRLEALKKRGGVEGAAAEVLDFIPRRLAGGAQEVGSAVAVFGSEAAKSAIETGHYLNPIGGDFSPGKAAERLGQHITSIPDQFEAWREQANDPVALRQVHGVATDLTTDPFTFVGGSTKGGAQTAASQAGRVARALKLSEPAAAELSTGLQKAARLFGHEGMQAAAGRAVVKASRAGGLEGAAAKAEARRIAAEVKRVAGEGGEYLGKGQLTVGVQPLNIQVEVADLLSKATGGAMRVPEQLTSKALAPVGAAARDVGRALGGAIPEGNAHERLMKASRAAEARRGAVAGTESELGRFADEVASLAPTDKARREQIIREFVDPDFRQVAAAQAEGVPGAVQHGDNWYVPVGTYRTPDFLSASEQRWVDALDQFFGRALDAMRRDGVDVGEAFNPISGKYIPRIFTKKRGLRGIFKKPGTQGLEVTHRSGAFSPFKARVDKVGRPLGRGDPQGARALYDPHEMVAQYVPKVERLKQKSMYDAWVADRFGTTQAPPTFESNAWKAMKRSDGAEVYVPNADALALEQAFDSSFKSLSIPWLQQFTSLFKEMNTIPVPRYHLKNVMGDMLLMYAGGLRRPDFRALNRTLRGADTDVAFEIPGQGRMLVGEVKELLRRAGIDTSISATRDGAEIGGDIMKGGSRGIRRSMDEAAIRGAKARGLSPETGAQKAGRIAKDYWREGARDVLGMGFPFGPLQRRAGAKAAEFWDKAGKTLFFIDRLKKGDSPRRAAQALYEVMPDYSDADKVLRVLRPIVPFATWQYRMAQNVPRIIARQPHVGQTTRRLADAFLGDDETPQDPPPRYVAETAMSHPVGAQARDVLNTYLQTQGVQPIAPGSGLNIRLPDPTADAMVPVGEAAHGNVRPLALMSHPLLGTAWEAMAQQDALTGAPMLPPELGRPFPTGMPGVPPSMQVGTDPESGVKGNPWLTRALPQMVMSPQVRMMLNELLGGAYLGRTYPRSARDDQRSALSEINLLTSLSPFLTDPTTEASDVLRDPSVEKAQRFSGGRKKAIIKAQQK